jgi:hypothetical protein
MTVRTAIIAGIVSVILIIALFLPGCSSSSPQKIKPGQPETTVAQEPDKTTVKPDEGFKPQPEPPLLPREILEEDYYQMNHANTISVALMFYRDAYGKFPDKVEELLDGWMLFWPINIYTHQPVKVLDNKPDPKNKDDLGNVFYEKVDNDKATIYYISLDQPNSTKDNLVYKLNSPVITYEAEYARREPENPRFQKTRELQDKPDSERIRYYYTIFSLRQLNGFFTWGMQKYGTFDESFTDLTQKLDYRLSLEGFQFLQKAVSDGWFTFDVGDIGDGELNYFKFTGALEPIDSCWKLMPELGLSGAVEKRAPCPDDRKNEKSIISSDNLASIVIPADVILNKEEIR